MVEIYFNAQSDNGTLTASESTRPTTRFLNSSDPSSRPCSAGVVPELHAECPAIQRPQSASPIATNVDRGWVWRGRNKSCDIASVRVVEW